MRLLETLAVNSIEARAVAQGADLERLWPIIAFAPSGPSYRLKNVAFGRFILTMGGFALTVNCLESLSKFSSPVPCFNNHASGTPAAPGNGKVRVIPADAMADQGQVGDVYALSWDPELYALTGALEAVDVWNDTFMTEHLAGKLVCRAFSLEIWGEAYQWKPNKRRRNVVSVYDEIEGLFSIDLVDLAAAAGRFLLPGCETPRAVIEQREILYYSDVSNGTAEYLDYEE